MTGNQYSAAWRNVMQSMFDRQAVITQNDKGFFLGLERVDPRTVRSLERLGHVDKLPGLPVWKLSEKGAGYVARNGNRAPYGSGGKNGNGNGDSPTAAADVAESIALGKAQHTALSAAIDALAAAVSEQNATLRYIRTELALLNARALEIDKGVEGVKLAVITGTSATGALSNGIQRTTDAVLRLVKAWEAE